MNTDASRTAGLPQLILLLAASSMPVLGAVLIAPVLPLIAQHFASVPGVEVLVPIVLTIPALVIGLTAPFAGQLVDRLGRLRVLQVGMVGYAVAGTAPLWLDGIGAIIASRVFVGVFEAGIATAAITLIGDYWKEKRDRYIGLQATTASLAGVVFIALGGALGVGGWRAPFWVYAIALVLVVPMTWLLWSPQRSAEPADPRSVRVPWRALAAPCGVTLFGGVVFYILIVQLSTVLTSIGITSTATTGLLTGVLAIAIAVGAALYGRFASLGRRVLLPVEFATSGLGLVIVFASSNVTVVMVGAVITGFASGCSSPRSSPGCWTTSSSPSVGAAPGSGRAPRTSASSSPLSSWRGWRCSPAVCRAASAHSGALRRRRSRAVPDLPQAEPDARSRRPARAGR